MFIFTANLGMRAKVNIMAKISFTARRRLQQAYISRRRKYRRLAYANLGAITCRATGDSANGGKIAVFYICGQGSWGERSCTRYISAEKNGKDY